jgi:hypothetical protein
MGIGGFLCLKLFYLLFYLYSFVFFHLNHITIIFFSFYFFEIKNNNQNSRRNNKEEKITLGFCVFSCKFCLDLRHFPIRQQSSFYFFFSLSQIGLPRNFRYVIATWFLGSLFECCLFKRWVWMSCVFLCFCFISKVWILGFGVVDVLLYYDLMMLKIDCWICGVLIWIMEI